LPDLKKYQQILSELKPYNATLVAVSKTKPVEEIKILFDQGQKTFGENYVQELVEKQEKIPGIEWHFIGHLQTNKIKLITPFISLIHGIDSLQLLKETDKQSKKSGRIVDCLLQIFIAEEETKFGLSYKEANEILTGEELTTLKNIRIRGLMGMATATVNEKIIRKEYKGLREFFDKYRNQQFSILSMGMTSDYRIALEEGSTMVRIGSAIFGERK
jgi:pyridoxal phosphate enzyme (YggS family)